MEAAAPRPNDRSAADLRLRSALIGFGYLQHPSPDRDNAKDTFDSQTEAVNRFRKACGWSETGKAGTSVQTELSRQVEALQTKLSTLDCFRGFSDYVPGHYDLPTKMAVAKFKTQSGQRAHELLEKFPILKQFCQLEASKRQPWLESLDQSGRKAMGKALTEVSLLDDAADAVHSMERLHHAAREFNDYVGKCRNPNDDCVCGEEIRWLLQCTPPFTFEDVFHTELAAIKAGRKAIGQSFGVTSSGRTHPLSRAHEARLMGLAFSGGGIRSATFNLGVLQALAKAGMLKRFDYLSSVSGGGYISGWLHAWVCRRKKAKPLGIVDVEQSLASINVSGSEHAVSATGHSQAAASGSMSHEPAPVAWLRRYSNYLTPRLGPLGADTMAAVATWLRNVLLNQTMLLLVAGGVLFLPWLLAWTVQQLNSGEQAYELIFRIGCFSVGFATAIATVANSTQNPFGIVILRFPGSVIRKLVAFVATLATSRRERHELGKPKARDVGAARATLIFILAACVCIGFALSTTTAHAGKLSVWMFASGAYAISAVLFLLYSGSSKDSAATFKPLERKAWIGRRLMRFFAAVAGGALFGCLLVLLGDWLPNVKDSRTAILVTTIVAPPSVAGMLMLALTLHIGLSGRALGESAREWWSRIGGIVTRSGMIWVTLTCVALYSAFAVMYANDAIVALGGLAWVATTVSGLLAGRSAKTGGASMPWRDLLARSAPYAFVAGLVVLVSWGLHGTLVWSAVKFADHSATNACVEREPVPAYELSLEVTPPADAGAASVTGAIDQPQPTPRCDVGRYADNAIESVDKLANRIQPLPPELALMIPPVVALLLAALLGLTVDVNVFSLHRFYRNRLERCYLGASNVERREDPYTDLDADDSPRLDALTLDESPHAQRPYPLINTALNLTRSSNLAWQERKAGSFVFTPKHCGYQLPNAGMEAGAFQKTSSFVKKIGGWISLGTPITISGAAASPNWGYHTHPATAALMTVFNVRLGTWIQNPRNNEKWRRGGPRQSLFYLLKELLANATEAEDFVYVSDGGHFENLALYELVRRRCRYLVVCDAGCDPDYDFEDLGNAVRKCKVDLGVDIEIDTASIRPDPDTDLGSCHCAVGVIHYERQDSTRATAPGYLLYVKASFTGDEPADVRQYRAQHPAFPHESTGDQWYSESQFESYRALGFHIMSTVLHDALSDEDRERHRRDARLGNLEPEDLMGSEGPDSHKEAAVGFLDREILFKRLAERWYRPLSVTSRPSELEPALQGLMTTLREDSRLRFLDAQIYPEWAAMARHIKYGGAVSSKGMLPQSHQQLRAGFYFCNQLILLMTKVYEERNLEGEHDHPDNRGWMNLFYHWSGSGMFRATWAVSISNYNGRFQQFCGRHLGLDIGRVQLGNRMQPGDAKSAHELLTNAEREHLRLLESANFDEELSWDNIAVVPLEVRVDQTDHTDETGFRFQIGIALIEGHFAIERDRQGRLETEPPRRRIRYFRIRDHLRRMGLGRRALEALWREDVKLQVDVPTDISLVIEEADPQGLLRLWHSVLAAVPNQELKLAHDLLNKVDENIDRKIKAQLGDEENAESKAIELRRTLPAPDDPDLERARSYYLAALKHQSDNEEAWRGIARVKAYRKDVAGAIAILDEVIRRDPNSSASYYNRAAIKMRMPEPDEKSSLNDLEKAIEIDFSLKTIARKDEDFNKIRKHRRFVRLIDKPMP